MIVKTDSHIANFLMAGKIAKVSRSASRALIQIFRCASGFVGVLTQMIYANHEMDPNIIIQRVAFCLHRPLQVGASVLQLHAPSIPFRYTHRLLLPHLVPYPHHSLAT